MVTLNQSHDRAQVILIGAIVIAFVILGVVVVFNGFLYTEEVSSSETSQSIDRTGITYDEIVNTMEVMVYEEYDENYQVNNEDDLEESISTYVQTYNKLQTNTSPLVVDANSVSVETDDDGSDEYEFAWVNSTELGPSNPSSVGNSIIIGGKTHQFTYDTAGKDDDITVTIDTVSGTQRWVQVNQVGSTIEVEDQNGNTCTESTGAEIDFLTGEINDNEEQCVFSIENLSERTNEIHFEADNGPGQETGQYDLIAEDITVGNAVRDHAKGISYVNVDLNYTSNGMLSDKSMRLTGIDKINDN